MANLDAPFGFKHVGALGGIAELETYEVDASNVTAIFKQDPLTLESDGGNKASAAGDGVSVGAVASGFKDSNGQSISFLPASTAGQVTAIPVANQIFVVQSDSGTNVAATDVNATADFVTGTGNTDSGFSRYELDASNIGTGQQLRIMGKEAAVGQENEFGDEHVNLKVVFVENAYADNTSI